MLAVKKGMHCIDVQQDDSTEHAHTLWPFKFCHKAGVNLFSLTCKLLQRKNTANDHQYNIVVKSTDGNIIID